MVDTPTLLDELAPSFDAASSHSIHVRAPAARVYRAVLDADLGGPAIVRLLMGARVAPALAAALLRRPTPHRGGDRCLGGVAFTRVAERPGRELVLGIMGQFWTLSGGLVSAPPQAFAAPPPHGLAQAVWSFRCEPDGAGTRLITETRVRCGDAISRRRFRRYWAVISFASGLTRRSMLRSIRRRAEKRHG